MELKFQNNFTIFNDKKLSWSWFLKESDSFSMVEGIKKSLVNFSRLEVDCERKIKNPFSQGFLFVEKQGDSHVSQEHCVCLCFDDHFLEEIGHAGVRVNSKHHDFLFHFANLPKEREWMVIKWLM